MKKKTIKNDGKVEKFNLTYFPVDVVVSTSQLSGLDDYEYENKGVTFEGELELRHLMVTGRKLSEEPVNEPEQS